MSRFGRNLLIMTVTGVGVAVLALFSGALAVADGDPESRTEERGKVSVVVVDGDGNRHEENYEFDEDHPRAFLGVELEGTHEGGARVDRVVEDSGAERAGLREGDVIVGVDGEEIESPWGVTRQILSASPGDWVDVEVLRDGERMTLSAELGERKHRGFAFGFDAESFGQQMGRLGEQLEGLDFDFDFDDDAFGESMEELHEQLERLHNLDFDSGHHGFGHFGRHSRPKLGVHVVETTPELREHLGGAPDEGVLVGRLIPGLPAEIAGVQVGDLIVAVDGEPIEDLGDLRRAVRDKDGESFDLDVIRAERRVSLRVAIPEAEDQDDGARHERRRELHPVTGLSNKT